MNWFWSEVRRWTVRGWIYQAVLTLIWLHLWLADGWPMWRAVAVVFLILGVDFGISVAIAGWRVWREHQVPRSA